MNKSPIFIHSLFRSGSTYLFKVFRRSDAQYWCYQESLHEAVIDANANPEYLLHDRGDELVLQLRHPQMDMPYFQELYETWPVWKNTLSAAAVYDNYFAPPNSDIGVTYWKMLAESGKNRPVFQECRTAGRIGAIKEQLEGYHIYLWRNPWDQWWSYKAAEYFDVANQLIINAQNPPAPVLALRSALSFKTYAYVDIAAAFMYFWERPLSAEDSYLVFYMLWCLGIKEGRAHANMTLNIDQLSDSKVYRDEVKKQLKEAGVNEIDFSDCNVPQGYYLTQDKAFFSPLEEKVHDWLIAGGWSKSDLDQVLALRQEFLPSSWGKPVDILNPENLAQQVTLARTLNRRLETRVAEISRENAIKVAHAEAKVQQALLQLHSVYCSTSWVVTKPLRFFKRLIKGG